MSRRRSKAAGAAVVAPLLVSPHPRPSYRARKAIRFGSLHIAAGDDLPLPAVDEVAEYQRLVDQGAVQVLVGGKPYIEKRIIHGARTRPTITRTPI